MRLFQEKSVEQQFCSGIHCFRHKYRRVFTAAMAEKMKRFCMKMDLISQGSENVLFLPSNPVRAGAQGIVGRNVCFPTIPHAPTRAFVLSPLSFAREVPRQDTVLVNVPGSFSSRKYLEMSKKCSTI